MGTFNGIYTTSCLSLKYLFRYATIGPILRFVNHGSPKSEDLEVPKKVRTSKMGISNGIYTTSCLSPNHLSPHQTPPDITSPVL